MKKHICRLMATVAGILLIVGLLFSCLQWVMNDRAYIEDTYARLDHARKMGMSTEDLVAATMRMIDYMEGSVDSIDLDVTVRGETVSMFNEQERVHMEDVRALYQAWRNARGFCLMAAVVLFVLAALLMRGQGGLKICCQGFLIASGVMLVCIAALGIWVATDFTSFWIAFHHLFFTNDLWMFDAATSRMINMMPEEFFSGIVIRFALWAIGIWAVLCVVCAVLLGVMRRRRKRA